MAGASLPLESYLRANETVRLLLLSAQAHERAGHTGKAIRDLNHAADIEVVAARAKRITEPVDRLALSEVIDAHKWLRAKCRDPA